MLFVYFVVAVYSVRSLFRMSYADNNLGGSYNYVTKPAMLTSFMLRLRVGYFSLCMKFSEYASLVFNLVLRFEMTRDFYRYHVDPVAIAVLRPL